MNDIEIIENINVLYDYPVILWGAGAQGLRLQKSLCEAGMNLIGYTDSNAIKWNSMYHGFRVLSLDDLKMQCQKKKTIIIISIESYSVTDSIEEFIAQSDITPYLVGSLYSVKAALCANTACEKFPPEFQKYQASIQKAARWDKEMYQRSYKDQYCEAVMSLSEDAPLLVYQGAKVGSSSIYHGLQDLGVPSVHVHYMSGNGEYNHMDLDFEVNIRALVEKAGDIKIITGVRDPIAWGISLYGFIIKLNWWQLSSSVYRQVDDLLKDQMQYDISTTWFDKELKENFGVDVFAYPFDREKGYTIIDQGNVHVFLYKTEALPELEQELRDFIGNQDFILKRENAMKDYETRYLYNELRKTYKAQKEIADYYYGNDKIKHFYSDEEIAAMRLKWS